MRCPVAGGDPRTASEIAVEPVHPRRPVGRDLQDYAPPDEQGIFLPLGLVPFVRIEHSPDPGIVEAEKFPVHRSVSRHSTRKAAEVVEEARKSARPHDRNAVGDSKTAKAPEGLHEGAVRGKQRSGTWHECGENA